MGHPDKLRAQYKKNEYLQYPYKMSSAEQEMYQQYSFAMQQYQELVNYLNSTSTELNEDGSQKGYGRGEFGLEKEMDQEMVELLKEKVANVITTAQVLYGSVKSNPKLSTEQKSLIYSIQQNLNNAVKENSVLENLGPLDKMSYMEMHARSTDVIIDVGEDNLDRVGDAASSRITIRYMDESGQLKSGFFTEDIESGVDFESIYNQNVKKGSPTDKFFQALDAGPNGHDPDLSKCKSLIMMLASHDGYSMDPIANLKANIEFSPEQEADLKALNFKLKECEDLYDFAKNIAFPAVKKEYLERDARQKEGNNINQRNTAMSDIATALGMPHLIAKSTPMTIIRNGKAVHGNFMNYAEGVDIEKIDPASELMNGKPLKFDYANVVTDACDMMVLDYICLNGDRHQNNHFYKIIQDSNGNPVLSGFQGIDNDLSFGSFVPNDDETHMKLPPLNDMKFITRKTADMVNGMTEAHIQGILMGKGLSNEEISACWGRVQKMQAYINRKDGTGPEILEGKPTKYHYDQMKDQAMEYYDEGSNNPEKDPTLTPILNTLVLDSKYKEQLKSFNKKYNDPYLKEFKIKDNKEKAKADRVKDGLKNLRSKVYIDDKMTMKSQRNQIKKLFWKMKSPRFSDNKQYKAMYAAVEDLNKTLKDFQKSSVKINNKVLNVDDKANILSQKFKGLQKTINEYVAKLPDKLSAKEDKMLSVAHALGTVCMEAKNSRERQVNSLNTIMKKTYKEVGRVGQALEEEKNPFAKALLQNEFNAKMHLGAFVGNCEVPDKSNVPKFADDFAKILVSNKLQQLKTSDPKEYEQHAKNFAHDSNTLKDMVESVKNNEGFKKMMKQVNPVNALVNNTISEMAKLGEDMDLFNNINVAPKTNDKDLAIQ